MKILKMIKRCYSLFGCQKPKVWIITFLKVLGIFLEIITAYCLSIIIANISSSSSSFEPTLLVLSITYAFSLVLNYFQFKSKQAAEKETRVNIKKSIMKLLFDNYPDYQQHYDSAKANEIIYTDSNLIPDLVFCCSDFFLEILCVIVVGVLLLNINTSFTLVLTLLYILISLHVFLKTKEIKKINLSLKHETDFHFKQTRDLLKGIKNIYNSNSCELHYRRYSENLDKVKTQTLERDKRTWQIGFFSNFCEKTGIVFFLLCGIKFVRSGTISASAFVLFFSYARIYSSGITRIFNQISRIPLLVVSIDRVFDLIKACEDKNSSSRRYEFIETVNSISISNITFSYCDKPVFSDFSCHIESSSTLITGKNGVGKTTLFNLIAGNLTPEKGNIYVNSTPINLISRACLHNLISYIPQDDFLFDMSIKENILSFAGGDAIPMSQVQKVCEQIGILDDILSLENGFDAKISEIRDLSYGQKKKILLVRAFLKPAQVILLDEPLAGLDAASQIKVAKYIEKLSASRMVVISTHKPENFLFCQMNYSL